MTGSEFRTELKKGLSGAYLFCGPEEYLKRHALVTARKTLIPDRNAEVFCHTILNDLTYSEEKLYDVLATQPFMQEQRLTELHGLDIGHFTAKRIEQLCEIFDSAAEYPYNVIILYTTPDELDIGTPKQPSSLFKSLSAHAVPVIFDRESPAKLQRWISQHFAAEGMEADPSVCAELLGRCGNDMYALSGEIAKLSAYAAYKNRRAISKDDIKYITVSNCEIDAFDFANSLLEGNADRAFEILKELKLRKEPPELILAGISRVYGDMYVIREMSRDGMDQREISSKLKMHEFRVGLYLRHASKRTPEELSHAIECCYEADSALKRTGLESYTVLEQLVAQTIV